MPNRFVAAAAAAVGVVLATAGAAAADDYSSSPAHEVGAGAFNNPPLFFEEGQDALINFDSPVVDARCAAPWYGSAVLGGSTPVRMQNVVCDSVSGTVKQIQEHSEGGLLF